jgi:hypothetical protein
MAHVNLISNYIKYKLIDGDSVNFDGSNRSLCISAFTTQMSGLNRWIWRASLTYMKNYVFWDIKPCSKIDIVGGEVQLGKSKKILLN